MGDSVGWTYRKDWFSRPEIKAEFKTKYKRDLAPPKTWDEFKQVAEFFQNRTIDGKKVYGAYIFTERGSEGITMGVTNVLYPLRLQVRQTRRSRMRWNGFVNSPDSIKGLEFYKSLYKCCTSPGLTNAYMQEGLDAFKSGQVAMMMNWFAFFPGLYKDPNVGGDKIGFFINPSENSKRRAAGRAGHFGRRRLRQPQRGAAVHQVVRARRTCRRNGGRWAATRCLKAVLAGSEFRQKRAVRQGVPASRWTWSSTSGPEPSYAQLLLAMQKRVHDYVVADKGTAKEALDLLGRRLDARCSRRKARSSNGAYRCLASQPPRGPRPGVS